jgi:hypothetical protein
MLMLMNAPILLGIIAVVFGLAPLLLRSNAVYIFLTLCAGEILATLVASDLTQVASSMVTYDLPKYTIVQLVLLLIAPVALLLVLKHSVKPAKILMQVIPAIATVVVAFMFVVKKLPYDTQQKMVSSNIYQLVEPFLGLAVAVGLVASIFYLWTKRPKDKDKEKKTHK